MISLRWKISGILVFSNLLLGLILVIIINRTVAEKIETELIERGRTIGTNLATYASESILSEDVVGLRQLITSALSFESVSYLLIQNSEMEILAETFNGQVPDELRTLLSSEPGDQPVPVFISQEDQYCYDISVPVEEGYLGYVHVGMRQAYIEETVSEITYLIVGIIAGLTLVGIVVVLFLANRIITPIIYLTQKANDISQGKLDTKVSVETRDEIQHLGEALERLRESVKMALERLQKRQSTRI